MAQDNHTIYLSDAENVAGKRKSFLITLGERIGRFWLGIFVLVFLLVLFFGYWLALKDRVDRFYQSQNIKLRNIADTVDGLKTADQNYDLAAGKKIDLTTKEKELLNLALPDRFDFSSLLVQLSFLASRHGLWIESVSYEDVSRAAVKTNAEVQALSSAGLQKVIIKLTVIGGGYESIRGFLNSLENSPMIFDVTSLNLKSTGQLADRADLNIVTYYFVR